jgi:hypothetical protein
VWFGAGLGLLISILFAVAFIIVYYTLDKKVFTGKGEQIFEGVVSVVASVMITILAFGMLKMMALQDKWNRKLKKSALEVRMQLLFCHSFKFCAWSSRCWALYFVDSADTTTLLSSIRTKHREFSLQPCELRKGCRIGAAVMRKAILAKQRRRNVHWLPLRT